jgi:hypothetical protein
MSSVGLILASMDLKLVQLIRGAMRAADMAAGQGCCGAAGRCEDVVDPTPRFEPRVVYHPTPRYEPRPVIHPVVRREPVVLPPIPAPCPPELPHCGHMPIEPVWKTLPDPVRHDHMSATTVKMHVVRPDIRHKGTLIDTFI